MRHISFLAGLAAIVFWVGGGARPTQAGTTLYNNLGATTDGSSPPTVAGNADSFSTGASAYLLTDVKLLLVHAATTSSFSVLLASDDNTHPDGSLLTIATVSDSSVTSGVNDFTLATPYYLKPHTRYWIELVSTHGSLTLWDRSADTSGTGVAGESYSLSGSVHANSVALGPFQMGVTGTAVPEPSSCVLCLIGGLGIAGYAVIRGRRRAAA